VRILVRTLKGHGFGAVSFFVQLPPNEERHHRQVPGQLRNRIGFQMVEPADLLSYHALFRSERTQFTLRQQFVQTYLKQSLLKPPTNLSHVEIFQNSHFYT
jgi:hypothetical protein